MSYGVIIIIIMLLIVGIFFTIKEKCSNNFMASVYSVFAAIIIGIVGNLIYEHIKPSPDTNNIINDENIEQQHTQQTYTIDKQSSSDEDFVNKTDEIDSTTSKKIPILEVDTFYSDGLEYYNSTITDNEGNEYTGYASMESGDIIVDYDGVAVYQNKNYARLSGKVITSKKFRNCDDCGWIKIYGDDNLLFDSGKIAKGISPKDFDLDITDYKEIKIEFKDGLYTTHESSYDYAVARCYLVNTYFYRQ